MTSTVIFWQRSPLATAVVTWAMLRTWSVRLEAMKLTESVRSFQVPATPGTCGLAAELAVGADLAGDAGHLGGEARELVDHRVHRRADAGELALDRAPFDLERHLLVQVTLGDGDDHARDLGRRADQVVDQAVDRVDRGGPRAAGAVQAGALGHAALAADDLGDADKLGLERGVAGRHLVVGGLEPADVVLAPRRQADSEIAGRGGLKSVFQTGERGVVDARPAVAGGAVARLSGLPRSPRCARPFAAFAPRCAPLAAPFPRALVRRSAAPLVALREALDFSELPCRPAAVFAIPEPPISCPSELSPQRGSAAGLPVTELAVTGYRLPLDGRMFDAAGLLLWAYQPPRQSALAARPWRRPCARACACRAATGSARR